MGSFTPAGKGVKPSYAFKGGKSSERFSQTIELPPDFILFDTSHEKQTSLFECIMEHICPGMDKIQILHLGYILIWNRGPQGPENTTYLKYHRSDCKARLATVGELSCEFTLKYHRDTLHTHPPDESDNIVSASLHDFRRQVKQNPEVSAKSVYEQIATGALESVETPKKLDLAKKQ